MNKGLTLNMARALEDYRVEMLVRYSAAMLQNNGVRERLVTALQACFDLAASTMNAAKTQIC